MAKNHHNHHHQLPPTRPQKVCFSFAAYAKSVIASLKSSDVHVSAGLTDVEITAIESAGNFTFPPDLRSIISEGLPVGPGFPNWRSSSRHQLRLLTSLPILSLSKEVSRNNFWVSSWGPRPDNVDEAHSLARSFLSGAPPLVPVFRHCYIPAEPNLAGNPVFYVHGDDVRLLSADVGGFFRETMFWRKDWAWRRPRREGSSSPAWTEEEARRVEFWTDAAAREVTCKEWWSGELCKCIEQVMWTLRDGGWAEEDVREMMMMDASNEAVASTRVAVGVGSGGVRDKEGVATHVRKMSRELLKSGWDLDDVAYSFSEYEGFDEDEGYGILDGEEWVDLQCFSSNSFDSVISCK